MTNTTTDVVEVSTDNEMSIDTKSLVASLSDMEEGVKLTGSYFNPEMGEEVRCFYIGKTTIKSIEGEGSVVAARLLLEDETTAITASTMIVGACSGLRVPTPIVITKTEERKLAKGKVLGVFEVCALQPKV